jgi:hypothetical protein
MAKKPTRKTPSSARVNTSKGQIKNPFSSKKVLLVFIVVFAVIGGLVIHFSQAASDPNVNVAQANEAGFQAIKASTEAKGGVIKPVTLPAKPANFGVVQHPTPLARPANYKKEMPDLPAMPAVPTNPQVPSGASSLITRILPSAYADGWTRSVAVAYAGKFVGWQGKYFFYYGVFPREEWCSDFVTYVMDQIGSPMYWGTDGWRMQYSGDVAVGLYALGMVRTNTYQPSPGDLIFFDWKDGSVPYDHIGIVESVDAKGGIHTIEGNTGSGNSVDSRSVVRKSWAADSPYIKGYGVWLGS